jgi:uncharacterized membrane protein YphA (DoxX/SURF4 family)
MVIGYALSAGGKASNWGFLLLLPVAFFLLAGLMTPFASVGALAIQSINAWKAGFLGLPCCVLGVLLLVAVLLLGPGAYSLDALRFGRRRVIVSRG